MADIEQRDVRDTAIFVGVTEIEGQRVSGEQLYRTCHRYRWAASLCEGRDVLEVACGSGPGLGLLSDHARSLNAGDISPDLLECVDAAYGGAIAVTVSYTHLDVYKRQLRSWWRCSFLSC